MRFLPEQVRLIVLFVVYGLTMKETADLEGIPLGTAERGSAGVPSSARRWR